ncbi:MAG: response regulator transcription factor [Candidatus Eremiobacteraeota bacterium]|nr:response regulator transcription factor [Candidatus Eremiobacteraeota bacterium]MBV8721521.1 response regulator transcription factor [Candidatus Eremiobacteraeota bacterium]
MQILVVEDNPSTARAIRSMLEAKLFAVSVAADGASGLELLGRHVHDAAIVDVGLPGIDGFELVRRVRGEGVRVPILMLSGRDAIEDRVAGFAAGADDYLVKPFAEDELLARVSALLRRTGERGDATTIEVGLLRVDVAGCTARYAGVPLTLGPTEFRLLEYLARNAGMTLSRAQILDRLREERTGSSNVVDVFVSQLRNKLRRCGADGVIETIWNVGYRLRP